MNLGHSNRLPQDVSAVVLFHDTALIGPQSTCHVRTREGGNQVVVFARDGRYFLRETPNGRRGFLGDARELIIDQTQDIGDIRITAKHYDPHAAAGARQ